MGAAGGLLRLAILLAGAGPERTTRRAEPAPPGLVLDKGTMPSMDGGPALIDLETGRLEDVPLRHVSSILMASPSPWTERGVRQIVGVGRRPTRTGLGEAMDFVGIVRMDLPGGDVLDWVDVGESPLPTGPPCWLPGTLARVIYPALDGRIYRLDFETADPDGGAAPATDVTPRVLRCHVAALGDAKMLVSDLSWPDGAERGRRLIASVRIKHHGARRHSESQVWWLDLDEDGESVVAGGRLLEMGSEGSGVGPRYPTLVRAADGALLLAYLVTDAEGPGKELRVAPVRFDAGVGWPIARDEEARILAKDCLPIAPVATTDGRWLMTVRQAGRLVEVDRLPLDL
jgi:hypothetical protein